MSAILWTRSEALTATQGRATGSDWQASGVSIDTRTMAPGDLFIAISGPNHDGHDFVAAALTAGATAALVQRVPTDLPANANLIVVDDSMEGLRALAKAARARSQAKIVAITGSVGKTGTKTMLELAFGRAGLTHASQGNLNNHLGAPLSLARMPREARFAVFELGMNHAGEIAPLSRLVRPHIAIITTVEAVHLEFFASTAEIAAAKSEIFVGVEPGGIAILPRDNPHYLFLREAAIAAGIARIESFGSHIESDARLLDAAIDPSATLALALFNDHPLAYRVGVSGRQWALNSIAVLLAARAAGASLEDSAHALAAMVPPKGRGARLSLPWGHGKIEVIDESYNASPVSMRAALATLGAIRPSKPGRRVAALGDMLELGADSPRLHAELAGPVIENRIDLVFTSGPLMKSLHDSLPAAIRGGHAANSSEAAEQVRIAVRSDDVIMVKGSAGSRMGRVIEALSNSATPLRPAANGV